MSRLASIFTAVIATAGQLATAANPAFSTTCNAKSYTYNELAGYGFVPSNARDKLGDTISLGSGIAISEWKKLSADKYEGSLYGLPDRGWNTQGTQNYQTRIHKFKVTLTLKPSASVANPSSPNVAFEYKDTILLSGPDGQPTTGLDPDQVGGLTYSGFPLLPAATYTGDGYGGTGPGGKRVSVDAEAIVLAEDGGFWISDEYGPHVYKFDKTGKMIAAIAPPAAIQPLRNGTISFSSDNPPIYDSNKHPIPANPTQGRKNSTLQCTSSRESANPFVEHAVQYSVAASKVILCDQERKDALQKLLLQGLDITILGSNDFYSYRNQIEARGLPLTSEALAAIPPFSSITFNMEDSNGAAGRCKPEVAKTGLGSSAAMTTSVVAALLHYLGAINLPFSMKDLPEKKSFDSDHDLVHIVAQSAHCIAQGKVGSGFDVSAAVYGSQRYIRFSPAVLSSAQVTGGKHLPNVISDILKEKWDHEKLKFSLPPLMTLLLGEPGSGGSSTPSMVGSVKQWQKTDPQKSLETWRKLADANAKLEKELKILNKFAGEQWEEYKQIISICSGHVHSKWMEQVADQYQQSVVKSLLGARDAFLEIRFHMQQMGNAAGVPIEPESQTQLLDATMHMEGVLLAGVPGAGGFDAVFAIILEGASDAASKAWSLQGVLPLLVREDPHGVSLESSDPRSNELTSGISSVKVN